MRVRLLNDGGYGDMENVKFPAEVEAEKTNCCFEVRASELYRIGATHGEFGEMDYYWRFLEGDDAETIE